MVLVGPAVVFTAVRVARRNVDQLACLGLMRVLREPHDRASAQDEKELVNVVNMQR